jgi:hypothetical protein
MSGRRRPAALAAAVLACAFATAGCGYALAGRGNTLPAYVRVIGVPPFVNHSSIPEIDRVLTEAVQLELRGKGRYTIQPEDAGVDAVLTATITNVSLQPVAFTDTRQVSQYAIVTTASVEFRDLHENKVLWANPALRVSDEYQVTTASQPNDANALFRQDANAFERMARKFAREVVTSVFEAF